MFGPCIDETPVPACEPSSDARKLAIDAAMRRVLLARDNWYAVLFGHFGFTDEHQAAEASARAAVIQADTELSRLLQEAAAGSVLAT